MKRVIFGMLILVFLGILPDTASARISRKGSESPAPTLRAPGDETDLSGKEMLEFRWSSEGDRTGFSYYDFRLYRGHQDYESGLMLKAQVPAGETSYSVPVAQFEAGQTYAWSVRQAGGSQKGTKAYSVFKVAKK